MPKIKDKIVNKKILKPVEDNSTPCSDLQFQVKKDVENDKKVRPSTIFEGYKKPKKLKKSK